MRAGLASEYLSGSKYWPAAPKMQASQEPKAIPAQAVPSVTEHSLTRSAHSKQGQMLVAGSINSPRHSKQWTRSRLHSGTKGNRTSTRDKLQHAPEGPIQENRYLPWRLPEARLQTGTPTAQLRQEQSLCSAQSLNGALEPIGRGCGWGAQLSLVRAIQAF